MASYADSNASFRSRALQIQLTPAHVTLLENADIKNFNHLAYSVSSQPGQLDDRKFNDIIQVIAPRGATLGVQAALRQLAFESLTVAVAAIRQRVEHPGEVARKLPAQEMDERLSKVRRQITGFTISGELEPAHMVINAFVQMLEEGALKTYPLSKCVTREQELNAVKADKQVLTLEGKEIQVNSKQLEVSSDLGNELRVQNAFIRRGIALEMSGLATYDVHERVTRDLMSHLTRTPPAGFKGPSIESVLRADRELWVRVADECRSNLRENDEGKMPVDITMEKHCESPAVLFHLLPLPASAKASTGQQNKRKADDAADPKPKQPKGGGKRQRKGGRSGKGNMPSGLHQYSGVNNSRQRICYNYNLPHGCHNKTEQSGGTTKCQRGVHRYIKCHGSHPLPSCNN